MSNLSELLPTGGGQNAVEFTAAENISSGQAVALKTDGQIEAADSANLANVIGLAAAAITSGATGDINVFGGINEAQSSLTIGTNYYINSSGSLTTSSTFPNIELGQAISATTINLRDLSDNHNPLVQGQQAYTSSGSYTWVAPAGVTSISFVCVGAGGGYNGGNGGAAGNTAGKTNGASNAGAGGSLAYGNAVSVTPGSSYTVNVGAGASTGNGGASNIATLSTTTGYAGGDTLFTGGGGAAGYSGVGGDGGDSNEAGVAGAGGGGGGGASTGGAVGTGAGGGGVGILGQGSNGAGGTSPSNPGSGGSGGANGSGAQGGAYGGGSGSSPGTSPLAAGGAVRIIWSNGVTRAFPSTNTGDL
tara:strand:- start:409 stop:1491 length:1083 start_codon:yes stop_codon:yes gene_type:complete